MATFLMCIDILLILLYNLFLKWARCYVCPHFSSMFIFLIYNALLHFLWNAFCPHFSSFLTRADVQTHACHTVTPSPAVANILHPVQTLYACHSLIAAAIVIHLSRVHMFHPRRSLLIRWATRQTCSTFIPPVTYIFIAAPFPSIHGCLGTCIYSYCRPRCALSSIHLAIICTISREQ